MHELSLFGQVPLPRHEQVLNILAGLSAMQPCSTYERHLIFQPLRSSDLNKVNKKIPNKPVASQPTAYVQLVKALTLHDFGSDSPLTTDVEASGDQQAKSSWTMRIQEIPEPETKSLVLRKVTENAMHQGGLEQYLDQAKYRFINEFIIEGQRLIHKNIVLTLHRILYMPRTEVTSSGPRTSLPLLDSLKLLDGSGSFVLEACVRIDDRTKPSLVQSATEELMSFRNEMKGSVDLRPPERLALDTRVRET